MVTFIIIVIIISIPESYETIESPGCALTKSSNFTPIVYWINLDSSVNRSLHMTRHLNELSLHNKRITAVTPSNLEIPKIVASQYRLPKCFAGDNSQNPKLKTNETTKRLFHISGLCGRPKNTFKELAVTVSHLSAIYEAIHSLNSSPYAVIAEDDIVIAFDIDFDELIKSAPIDFTILQLITSNDILVRSSWELYKSDPTKLWIFREDHRDLLDFWCAGFYIIHKENMRKIIDSFMSVLPSGKMSIKILAGWYRKNKCVPKICCDADMSQFNNTPPCVLSPRGYSADHFIYSLGKVYVITVPLIMNGKVGDQSTLHQEQVKMHEMAFSTIQKIIFNLRNSSGKETHLPTFARNFPEACGRN